MFCFKSTVQIPNCATVLGAGLAFVSAQNDSVTIDKNIVSSVAASQFDFASEGYEFLLRQANSHDLFLLGKLHADNEIPVLIQRLWRETWKRGYRHVAAEISPRASQQLEFVRSGEGPNSRSLWTKDQANAWTPRLVVLSFIELSTQKVGIGRNLTDCEDGRLSGKPYLITISPRTQHQELENRSVSPDQPGLRQHGDVLWRERLGGLLNYSHRAA